jgi:hypothetical protein
MKKIWILAFVKRGFIQKPEIFFSKHLAHSRRKTLMKDFNRDYDEIEIFEKYIPI